MASIRLFQKLGATPKRIECSRLVRDDESAARFEDEHMYMVDGHVREMAALFDVDPKKPLGSVLVFEVPADDAA